MKYMMNLLGNLLQIMIFYAQTIRSVSLQEEKEMLKFQCNHINETLLTEN